MTYDEIKKLVAGRDCSQFPLIGENEDGEMVFVTDGYVDDGEHYFRVEIMQMNPFSVIHYYYADGTIEEMFSHDTDADGNAVRKNGKRNDVKING